MFAKLSSAIIILAGIGWNNWQGYQPSGQRYVARNSNQLPQQSNIVFQHNFYDGAGSPQVGSSTFTRSGTVTYPSSSTVLSSAATDVLAAPSYRFGGTETYGGLQVYSEITNSILQSEDFTTTWTLLGTGGRSANTATAPDGTLTADTISGAAGGDGVTQSSALAAASTRYAFSVWLKTSTGTATVSLRIADNTSSELHTNQFTVGTTWKRFEVVRKFTAAASGNVKCQILVGNTSNVRAWGAMLEDFPASPDGINRTSRAYIKTTVAAATVGRDNYDIANSVATQVATKGSIAMWVSSSRDPNDYQQGGGAYIIRTLGGGGQDRLSVILKDGEMIGLLINDAFVVQTDVFNTYERDYWFHLVVTWDTDADQYKIYKNGVLLASDTVSSAAANITTETITLGSKSNTYNFDGMASQVIVWKTVLSSTDVTQVYASKSSGFIIPFGTGKLFSVALGTSPVPTVGGDQYWYGRVGSMTYNDTVSTVATAADGSLPTPAYILNGYNKSGMLFNGNHRNHILQSEAITTTWTSVAAGTITAGVGTFLGTITYGTINGNSGDGIQQSVAIATANNTFTGSMYVSVGAGTLNGRITIEGDSGGTPETTNFDFTATTTPTRVNVYKVFSSGATGNIRLKLTLRATGTMRVGGAMLERVNFGSSETSVYKISTAYIKTTTASVSSNSFFITYKNNRIFNPIKGTFTMWAAPFFSADDPVAFAGPTFLSSTGNLFEFYPELGPSGAYKWAYRSATPIINFTDTWTANQWQHWAWVWDSSTDPGDFRIYRNGTLVTSATPTKGPMSPKNIYIGNMCAVAGEKEPGVGVGVADYWLGVIDLVEIYGSPMSGTEVLNDYNNTKATYGL